MHRLYASLALLLILSASPHSQTPSESTNGVSAASSVSSNFHPKGDYVSVNGARLWYESEGSGPALVLISGGPGISHDYFHPYFSSSLAQSFKIIDIARECVLLEGLGAIGFATSQRVEVNHPIGIRQRWEDKSSRAIRTVALLSTLQSADIVLPTTDGREIRLRRITEPTAEQKSLLHRLGLTLPERLKSTAKCSADFATA
jgi:hypothetical protein